MDLLKAELERKRRAVDQDFAGKKFLKRSDLHNKHLQQLRDQERRDLHSKSIRTAAAADADAPPPTATTTTNVSTTATSSSAAGTSSATAPAEERRIDDLVLPRVEVIRRLRMLKQPITLFGEDDDSRLERLKMTMKAGVFEVDSDMTEGQTNDFLRDIYEMRKGQKTGIMRGKGKKEKEGAEGREGSGGDGDLSGDEGSSGGDGDKDLKRMKADFEGLCGEDRILVYFKRLLNEWKQELKEMPDAERRSAKGKGIVATYKQCARYLTPLFKFCRKKILPDDIRQALLVVVDCCQKRNYSAAADQYIKLAIGNAPWPIGVTMVGIHERSAREKIYTNSVAHIMNDETTRKYLQSIKRLVTFCQRRYPTMPSMAVEFNSLANGSDLESLLAAERTKAGAGGRPIQAFSDEEKHRFLPAPSP